MSVVQAEPQLHTSYALHQPARNPSLNSGVPEPRPRTVVGETPDGRA